MIKLLDKYSASVSLVLGQAGAPAPFPVNFALNAAGVALAARGAMIQRSLMGYIGIGLAQLGFIPAEWLAIGLIIVSWLGWLAAIAPAKKEWGG